MIGRYGESDGFDGLRAEVKAMEHVKNRKLSAQDTIRKALHGAGATKAQLQENVQVLLEVDCEGMPAGYKLGFEPIHALELVEAGKASFTAATPAFVTAAAAKLAARVHPVEHPVAVEAEPVPVVPVAPEPVPEPKEPDATPPEPERRRRSTR